MSEYPKQKDFLAKHGKTIEQVKLEWQKLAKGRYQKEGDVGPVIMGDGVYALLIPPRCKNPKPVCLISSAEIACTQGNAHYEVFVDKMMKKLKKAGIDCYYSHGRMD